jgi:Mor family transcriptional regulator
VHGEVEDIDGLFNDIDKIFEDEMGSRWVVHLVKINILLNGIF